MDVFDHCIIIIFIIIIIVIIITGVRL